MHLIALAIKQKMNIPWIADFRDPWTNIDFYHQLMLTKKADKKHKQLEKTVLKMADEVVTVSWNWADDFKKICGRELKVITNGFDPQDFQDKKVQLSQSFSITHIGSMNADRNPPVLWEALSELCKEIEGFKKNLKLILIGPIDFSIIQSINNYNLKNNLKKIDSLPHKEALKYLEKSQVLLLPINNTPNVLGVVPGKLYEYLGAKRPIICIGPNNSDSAKIINETNGGKVSSFTDKETLKKNITTYYNLYKKNALLSDPKKVNSYSRKFLIKKFTEILDQIT
jgi:hypothetical protein